ncbi:MAG TPA: WcbI family polysaccharide biosynthesis putative acetyltransferase [Rhodopila sp.]|nr:WcbI family polysaccharide biosynthesis putative acetyltransferase [Rhodopila sp.]
MADAPETLRNRSDDPLDDRALLRHFESLGGAVRGAEFGHFQHNLGVAPLGLLSWADLAARLVIDALEQRFEGVGDPETTIVFRHSHGSEWWTRDTRFWMAMRTHVQAQSESPDDAVPEILERLHSLRDRLLIDLREGRKLFVFRDLVHNLEAARLDRLHAAIRSYGPGTLFYLRYEDTEHPAGLVEAVKPGLLIGYVAHFSFSRQNQYIGPIDDVLLSLCRRAWALHQEQSAPTQPRPEPSFESSREPAPPAPEPPLAPPPAAPIHHVRRASRQIVFVGNVQAEAMANLYRRYVAPRAQDRVEHVPTLDEASEDRRATLEQADLIVEQVMDLAPTSETSPVAPGVPRVPLPLVSGAFLWPFRAQAHPKAVSYPFLPGGPFDAETSDSYLNRLIVADADPEQAVEEYVNLDLAKVGSLDRLYGLMIDRQRARDTAIGYDIAPLIERHFKTDYIFLTPYHPNTRVALAMAETLFRRLGATNDDIDRMRARTRVSPFPTGETPIHPGVCRHWGLSYIAPDQRYRFRNEGAFTFREYALRYMKYEWNPALEEGLWLSGQHRQAEAVAPLRSALALTPRSAAARAALGDALRQSGDHDTALTELREAIEIDPAHAGYHAALSRTLHDLDRVPQAEIAIRRAVEADPTEPDYAVRLAHLLRQQNRFAEAAQAFEAALSLDPWVAQTWRELAEIRESQTDQAGAEQARLRAAEIDSPGADLDTRPAEVATRQGDATEAPPAAPRVEPQPEPANPRPHPDEDPPGQVLSQAALQNAFRAAAVAPDNAGAYDKLGCLLREAGDAVAAEQAFHRALALRPTQAHYHHELSVLYLQIGRQSEAVEAAEEAITLEPTNLQRRLYLADVLASREMFDQAREVLSTGLARVPDYLPFRIMLSDLFAREGHADEALTSARAITRDAPDNAQALGHLAYVEQMMGRSQDAEMHLRSALALAPDNGHLRRQLERLLQRSAA